MAAKYLLRLDDACETMDRRKWGLLEDVLKDLDIKPIVAVVPDNKDPLLNIDTKDENFWEKVRFWQSSGWSIAMHGYTHEMHHTDAKMILPYYKRSEFAGLSYSAQARKIKRSWNIFTEKGVVPNVWVAPAHCFDEDTLRAIFDETSIRIVSDGIAFDTFYDKNFHWVPQQLWRFKEKSHGLWTVCLHPNMMSEKEIIALGNEIGIKYRSRMSSIDQVTFTARHKSFSEEIYEQFFWMKRKAAQYVL